MPKFLGHFPTTNHPNKSPQDWAMYFIESYGQTDGAHHKQWVIDQVARILKGTPVECVEARWDDGSSEFRAWTGTPSAEYLKWVKDMCDGEDGPETYTYDEGYAP